MPKSDEGWNREAEGDRFQKDLWLDWNECLVHVTMVYRRFRPIADHLEINGGWVAEADVRISD